MKKRRKLNIQKTFCTISAGIILACIIFYGYRFITLYLENKKTTTTEDDILAKEIIKNNKDSGKFENINGDYYFINDSNNNYVLFSNMLWRIVKVNNNNTITLISNDNLSYLAFADEISDYSTSYVNKWLNEDVLINQLDKNPLTQTKICTDNISKVESNKCSEYNSDNLIGLLSVTDYINAGADESYLNNNKFFYLSSINEDEVWYVTSRGKVTSSNNKNLYGVRPTITIKADVKYTEGNGNDNNPYIISSETLFGSYVKLNNEIWRVYEVNGDTVKLSLNDYLKVDDEDFTHIYSNQDYYHNDTVYGSLAFYLNQTYINKFSNPQNLLTTKWANGALQQDYNYKNCLETTIDSKIATLSIGNVILNDSLSDYFLMNGTPTDDTSVYKVQENGSLDEINVSESAKVIPTITISKDKLTKGNGTNDEPYEVE